MKIREFKNYIRLVTLSLVGIFFLLLSVSTRAQSPTSTIVGTVLDAQTGSPVENASVSVTGIGSTRAVTDAAGRFAASDISVAEPFTQVTITLTAPGYGSWTMRDTPLYPGITRMIRVLLTQQEQLITDTLPRALIGGEQLPIEPTRAPRAPQYFSNTLPPATIRVAITGYAGCQAWLDAGKPVIRIDTVDFREYVKNVLPHEWIASWPSDSLRAGAMAVKMHAWYIVNIGKWTGVLAGDPDIVDNTCDQYYVAGTHYSSTDTSVDYTWLYRMRKNSQVVSIHYLDGHVALCQDHQTWRCMEQWGTRDRAIEGLDWQSIVHYYYDIVNSQYDPVQIDTFGTSGGSFYLPMILR